MGVKSSHTRHNSSPFTKTHSSSSKADLCKVEKFVCWVSETNDTHSRSTPRLTQGEVKGIRSIAQATEPFKAISIRMNARGHRDEIERSPDDSQSLRESESLYQKHSEFTDCRFRGHFLLPTSQSELLTPIFCFRSVSFRSMYKQKTHESTQISKYFHKLH